jgi:hypothetical protein
MKRIFKRCEGLVEAEIDSEMVIMSIENGAYYGLNEVARKIWELLAEQMSVDNIIEALQREYDDADNQLREDVLALLKDMRENRMIELDA